jgi:hypothetical protein
MKYMFRDDAGILGLFVTWYEGRLYVMKRLIQFLFDDGTVLRKHPIKISLNKWEQRHMCFTKITYKTLDGLV